MTKIEFDSETLGNILQTRKNLQVPTNQRSYAWKKEHVDDLFKDLNAAITRGKGEYFLGAIIVVRSISSVDVYDGQQRLATTLVLIAAIRDFFFRIKDIKTAEAIANDFLRSLNRKDLSLRPHLRLSAEDNQFFVDRILRMPDDPDRKAVKLDQKKESHQLLDMAAKEAASHVQAITKPLPAADRGLLLQNWLDFLVDGARVIWAEVADEQTAFRIFETMNDRGLKLSAADLLKNYLYSLAGSRKAEVVQKWQSMIATLESLGREDGDIVDYIRYFWVTSHGPTRVNNLFDEIKSEVNSEPTAVAWVSDLESRAGDYAAILTPTHEYWSTFHQEVRASVDTLRYLGVSQIRPLLLAAIGKFTPKEVEKLLKLSVSWSVRCLIVGVPSGTLEGYYSRSAKRVHDNAITDAASLRVEMSGVIPADDAFEAAARTVSVPTASLARYYLRRLQIQKDDLVEPQYTPNDGKAVTLEHVLPQRPGENWKHIELDVAKTNYNRLGNQALLAGQVNSKIGNVGFDAKKTALLASPFSLTSEIAESTKWGLEEIVVRQTRLASLAVKAWPLAEK